MSDVIVGAMYSLFRKKVPVVLMSAFFNSTGEQRNGEGTDEKTADGAER